jgi:methylated-DNA-protein-cysteine methyltransferase related protein
MVRRIPAGKVATYGQIAALAGFPGHGRLTGYALHGLKDGTVVPWYRVVNAAGRISFAAGSEAEAIQRSLLQSEGVRFNQDGTIPMNDFQWRR